MRIGIGIDTGGTYTDAVLYDFDAKELLAKNKSLTTKENLSIGIKNAISSLPRNLVEAAEVLSVSTTLATNACVEKKGGRAKLLLVGTNKATLEWIDAKATYGLQNDSMLCIDTKKSEEVDNSHSLNWDEILVKENEWFKDAQALAIVAKDAIYNGSLIEKDAKKSIEKRIQIPFVMANEVADNINMLERGATAVLNARLLSVVEEFVEAIHSALDEYHINAKKMIVRSDGSLMSEKLILTYPVKTILSGPAASVIGAMGLAKCKNSLIIDMGGTTTDISIVENGNPAMTDGITIGGYRTQVQGVLIDTFSLGGDTRIIVCDGKLALDSRRVMPLCALSKKYPQIKKELQRLVNQSELCGLIFHEFLCLVKQPKSMQFYSEKEKEIIESLRNGPVSFSGSFRDLYKNHAQRLENEGIVMKGGLTPTDFMHIKGDFSRYDTEASVLGATYLQNILPDYKQSIGNLEVICDEVYNLVRKKLYTSIIKTLCIYRNPQMYKKGFDEQFEHLIEKSWDERNEKHFCSFNISVDAVLIGIGAPTHIFLKDVALACNTTCVIPKHAEVANALGAIIADISSESKAAISPQLSSGISSEYVVYVDEGNTSFESKEEAIEYAKNICKKNAIDEAKKRGALGDLSIVFDVNDTISSSSSGESIYLGSEVKVRASGRV